MAGRGPLPPPLHLHMAAAHAVPNLCLLVLCNGGHVRDVLDYHTQQAFRKRMIDDDMLLKAQRVMCRCKSSMEHDTASPGG